MKSHVVAGIALALVLSASPLLAARTNYKASMDTQVVGSSAVGEGRFTFDDTTKLLCGKITYSGLTGGALTQAVLKNSNDNTQAEALTPSASPVSVSLTLTPDEVDLLTQQSPVPGLYVALGNTANPAGNAVDANGELNGELRTDNAGTDQCPPQADDAGVTDGGATDAGASSSGSSGASSSGTSGASSSGTSGASSSGTSGASSSGDAPAGASDAGGVSDPGLIANDSNQAPKKDDGGCSTSGSTTTGGALLVGLTALVLATRRRRND